MSPGLLKAWTTALAEPLQWVFNLSLHFRKVSTLSKMSCIVAVPKKNQHSELNNFPTGGVNITPDEDP